MQTYLYLGKFSDGVKKLMASSEYVIESLAKMGVNCKQQWLTFSEYDYAVLVEAESELAVQRSIIFAKEEFGITTTILRCFEGAEALEAVGGPEALAAALGGQA